MSSYERLPNDLLVGLLLEMYQNIQKGILSQAMYTEIHLMRIEIEKRSIHTTIPNYIIICNNSTKRG